MRVSLVASALAAAAVANAVIITETLPPSGICWETGTITSTITAPGVTTTVHDPHTVTSTRTVYVYPTKRAFQDRELPEQALPAPPQVTEFKARAIPPQARAAAAFDEPEKTTIVEIVPCFTSTFPPVVTKTDDHITATTTQYASTAVETYTYTLCIEGHMCG
ncbi:hypothetical protein EXIGLDRAFT_835509 [Exidia glandulosa HHB12029]|uniref:Uncharacterized protein n=1 Tax=Exidia glandulosa HHB12029 TaxID=1314781 RepID=A0A165IPA6_EXIGL|nr:hypothetical protein EXIGLDRAFT_835509 [Exidia glandulosa HHB12029]